MLQIVSALPVVDSLLGQVTFQHQDHQVLPLLQTHTAAAELDSLCHFLHQSQNRQAVCDHITPVLWQLHWLPIRQRVVFKIAGLVHQLLVGLAPAYLADDCRLLSDTGRRPLRSNFNDTRKLLVLRTHNKLGDRSFSAAGPRLWNDLPHELRRPGLTFDSFRQSLKTHLFGDGSA